MAEQPGGRFEDGTDLGLMGLVRLIAEFRCPIDLQTLDAGGESSQETRSICGTSSPTFSD